MLKRSIYFIAILLIAMSCTDEDTEISWLEPSGILGTWERESLSIDGTIISQNECCYYLSFSDNRSLTDYTGSFDLTKDNETTGGSFRLNEPGQTIIFIYFDREESYNYSIEENQMTFTYAEDDTTVIEVWRKSTD